MLIICRHFRWYVIFFAYWFHALFITISSFLRFLLSFHCFHYCRCYYFRHAASMFSDYFSPSLFFIAIIIFWWYFGFSPYFFSFLFAFIISYWLLLYILLPFIDYSLLYFSFIYFIIISSLFSFSPCFDYAFFIIVYFISFTIDFRRHFRFFISSFAYADNITFRHCFFIIAFFSYFLIRLSAISPLLFFFILYCRFALLWCRLIICYDNIDIAATFFAFCRVAYYYADAICWLLAITLIFFAFMPFVIFATFHYYLPLSPPSSILIITLSFTIIIFHAFIDCFHIFAFSFHFFLPILRHFIITTLYFSIIAADATLFLHIFDYYFHSIITLFFLIITIIDYYYYAIITSLFSLSFTLFFIFIIAIFLLLSFLHYFHYASILFSMLFFTPFSIIDFRLRLLLLFRFHFLLHWCFLSSDYWLMPYFRYYYYYVFQSCYYWFIFDIAYFFAADAFFAMPIYYTDARTYYFYAAMSPLSPFRYHFLRLFRFRFFIIDIVIFDRFSLSPLFITLSSYYFATIVDYFDAMLMPPLISFRWCRSRHFFSFARYFATLIFPPLLRYAFSLPLLMPLTLAAFALRFSLMPYFIFLLFDFSRWYSPWRHITFDTSIIDCHYADVINIYFFIKIAFAIISLLSPFLSFTLSASSH